MKFEFIRAEKAELPIEATCRALGVSCAGYHAFASRPESAHSRKDRRLTVLVREIFEKSRSTYGTPQIHAALKARDIHVSRKRVARILRELGLKARVVLVQREPESELSRVHTASTF